MLLTSFDELTGSTQISEVAMVQNQSQASSARNSVNVSRGFLPRQLFKRSSEGEFRSKCSYPPFLAVVTLLLLGSPKNTKALLSFNY